MPSDEKQQRFFKLLSGEHRTGSGEGVKIYSANNTGEGNIVPHTADLVTLFPNKFEEVDEDGRPVKRQEDQSLSPQEKAGQKERKDGSDKGLVSQKAPAKGSAKKDDQKGENVTDDFPAAGDNDLEVFKDGRRYVVKDGDKVVKEDIRNKAGVLDAIEEYVKEGEEDVEEEDADEEDGEAAEGEEDKDAKKKK